MNVCVLGEKVETYLEKLFCVSVKWLINKCCGCSWFKGKWSIGEFSFKGSVGSVCTEGWSW